MSPSASRHRDGAFFARSVTFSFRLVATKCLRRSPPHPWSSPASFVFLQPKKSISGGHRPCRGDFTDLVLPSPPPFFVAFCVHVYEIFFDLNYQLTSNFFFQFEIEDTKSGDFGEGEGLGWVEKNIICYSNNQWLS